MGFLFRVQGFMIMGIMFCFSSFRFCDLRFGVFDFVIRVSGYKVKGIVLGVKCFSV